MADAFTDINAVSTVTAAYDRLLRFALRLNLVFDKVATVKPTNQTHPGSTVKFFIYDDLAEATGELTETQDVTSVALSDSDVTVTLREYGNATVATAKLAGLTLAPTLSADIANIVNRNAVQSIDSICRTELFGGTNEICADGVANTASINAANTLGAAEVRQAVAELRGDGAVPMSGEMYMGFMHPDQSVDLRTETGAAAWTEPANYSDATRRWRGVVGAFEGVIWVETGRCPVLEDGGVSNVDVYQAIVVGQEALAKAFSRTVSGEQPKFVLGPVVDRLKRLQPYGWYWLGGYKRFREDAIQRIESSSSIGANA